MGCGVDEHVWKHTSRLGEPSTFVTVIVHFAALESGGTARLLDMIPGRRADALGTWLSQRSAEFRDLVQVVTMDGFTGYATACSQQLPKARKVMDPFHVVHLALEKMTKCRQRTRQETTGHRGAKSDPLYQSRRSLLTRAPFLTTWQKDKLTALFTDER